MTEADIDRIVTKHGYTLYIDVRVKARGDGTVYSYVHLRKRGLRRPLHLGELTKLTKMSEADLVSLIKSKTNKEQL